MGQLLPALFLAAAFCLAAWVEPWFQSWEGSTSRRGGVMQILLGDSRRMFANHSFDKAEAYFHRGFHPTFFDEQPEGAEAHVAGHQHVHEHEQEHGHEHCAFLREPLDWIDAFSRNFYPVRHTELGEAEAGGVGEMLPWLRLSVDLDPHRVQSYVVAAYWLWERMDKADAAEQFLKEGLRANPDSAEILYELGRIASEARADRARARDIWLMAVEKWKRTEGVREKPDVILLRDILSKLSHLEELEGRCAEALAYLKQAKAADMGSPLFDRRLMALEEKLSAPSP
jgi:tetratricopeptide (TPR) repeat protein